MPAINWRIYETDNAGTSCTPTLLATQVVPQIMQVSASAKYALPFLLFLIFSFVTINDKIVMKFCSASLRLRGLIYTPQRRGDAEI